MVSAVIIDDEKSGRTHLATLVNQFCSEIEIAGMADGVESGLQLLKESPPQLLFLDIEMNDGTGFDLLEKYGRISFEVIFVTAYNQYGVHAIKFSAIDYILKPIDERVLMKAVDKAAKQIELKNENIRLKNLLQNVSLGNQNKRIALPFVDHIDFVEVNKIIRLEAEGSYTRLIVGDDVFLVSKNLKEYEEMLSLHGFIRTHQAHLVNPAYIKSLVKSDGGYLLLVNGDTVPISRLRKNEVISLLK